MREYLRKIWHSSTLMTWGSFFIKAINLVIILPMVLNKINPKEIVVWFLFLAVIALIYICDVGFSPSFSRAIAYAMGGGQKLDHFFQQDDNRSEREPNWSLISKIYLAMGRVYIVLTLITTVLVTLYGTYYVYKPILATDNHQALWAAWIVIVISTPIIIFGVKYATYLVGVNKIALVKRYDILFTSMAVIISLIIISVSPSILAIIINNQFWLIVNVVRDYNLVKNDKKLDRKNEKYDKHILSVVWRSSWKTALGLLASYGIVQFTGIYYAQVGKAGEVAAYLLSLKIISSVIDFSRAPFYTKLPVLSAVRAQGDKELFRKLAQKGMAITMFTYTIAVILIGFLNKFILTLVHSKVHFISNKVWVVLCWAFFFERYGALQIQLFSITNKIIWHIANVVTGAIIFLAILIYYHIGVGAYLFPIGLLTGYFVFYSWYPAMKSYGEYKFAFFNFEKFTLIVPGLMLLIYSVYVFCF